MIDFRYYIVTIVAIFLALGLGAVAGTTVLDRVVVDRLDNNLKGLRSSLDEHRRDIRELTADLDQSNDLVEALAPRVTEGVLVGLRVLFVTVEDDPEWHASVRDAITEAGAESVGSIVLTPKWLLKEAGSRDELVAAFEDRALGTRNLSDAAAGLLGQLIVDDEGAGLVSRLADAGFIRPAPAEGAGTFPPLNANVVVLGSDGDEPLAPFAVGASGVSPTLAVAASVEDLGPVAALRRLEDPPAQLATFDAAAEDPAGVGTVLAMRAAADGAGGHFGRGSGLRFLPTP